MSDKLTIENARITDKGVEGKQTKDGKDYAAFTIMWSSSRKDRATGEWENGPTKFINVKVFGFQKYDLVAGLNPGDRVNVSGNVEHFEWQSNNGPKDDWTMFAESVTLPVPRSGQNTPQADAFNRADEAQAQQGGWGQPAPLGFTGGFGV